MPLHGCGTGMQPNPLNPHHSRQQITTKRPRTGDVMSAQPTTPTPAHIVDGFAGAVGNTPLIRLRRASAATGLRDPRQGGVHEARRQREGPRRRSASSRMPSARGAAGPRPARHHRRGHRGQYRHRPDAGRQCPRLQGVIVVPETQSREKIDFLRMIGADLRLIPPKPFATRAITCMSPAASPRRWPPPASGCLGQPVRQPGQRRGA